MLIHLIGHGLNKSAKEMQSRLTVDQETILMRETAELFVPTMRALYNVVSKPSQETWLQQALPYAIAFKSHHWSMDEQTREAMLPDAEPMTPPAS